MKDWIGVFLGLQYTSGNYPASCHAKEVSFLSTSRVGGGPGRQCAGQRAGPQAGGLEAGQGLRAAPPPPGSARQPADPQGDL